MDWSGRRGRPVRVPVSTYRLQLQPAFTFVQARDVVEYLSRLGITDCYCSPYLAARSGSTHGYDVTDHTRLNPELGTPDEFDAFSAEIERLGMGHILDFVPNHMGIDPWTNPWWRDVLENGACSLYARYFDIDWDPVKPELKHKILLPILPDQYGNVLERGELRLRFFEGGLAIEHGPFRLPINPRQAPMVYRHDLDRLRAELGDDHPHVREFLSILSALHNMPGYTEADPELIAERHREKEVSRERLVRLVDISPRIREHIDAGVAAFNGEPGHAGTFNLLHDLLETQPYRLSYWRTAMHEINYRRFFDVNDLAGLRIEDPDVFTAIHTFVADLLDKRRLTGLRIDHPDGLFDPAEYCARVQEVARRTADRGAGHSGTPRSAEAGVGPRPEKMSGVQGTPRVNEDRPLYLLVEKILSGRETLQAWPVHGTTGYNFMNVVNGLFVDGRHARSLRRIYARITGRRDQFRDIVYRSKQLIMETALASELNVLAHALGRLAEGNRRSRDFTLNSLRDVIEELVACFPVYRTYIRESGWTVEDRDEIEAAFVEARRRNPAFEHTIFDFLREILLPRTPPAGAEEGDRGAGPSGPPRSAMSGVQGPPRVIEDRRHGYPPADEAEYRRRLTFTMKFQQYTGPVQAKGVEDTAFYRYNLLVSLNEVGGDPGHVGQSPADFHALNRHRREQWPYEMSATATHDAKLGEDVRARINVLSELPDEWRRAVGSWFRLHGAHRRLVHGEPAPDRNDEYRFYQVLVGAWPMTLFDNGDVAPPPEFVTRMREYMIKSIKEAKIHTSWINENLTYDDAVARFVEGTLGGSTTRRFMTRFVPFARRVAQIGAVNALAQVVLKVASPGVPDFYQGTELWSLTLVDPDNRHPVDFEHRVRLLDALPEVARGSSRAHIDALLHTWTDGRIKMHVTASGLRARRQQPDLFLDGDYSPLAADVKVDGDVVAFARQLGDAAAIAVVPRLVARLGTQDRPWPVGAECWKESRVLVPQTLAARSYVNVITGEEHRQISSEGLRLADLFATCPVALLIAAT
jgi:(1->4)-alpha-D-glucan 1-alpha-D-glucosylmutase